MWIVLYASSLAPLVGPGMNHGMSPIEDMYPHPNRRTTLRREIAHAHHDSHRPHLAYRSAEFAPPVAMPAHARACEGGRQRLPCVRGHARAHVYAAQARAGVDGIPR